MTDELILNLVTDARISKKKKKWVGARNGNGWRTKVKKVYNPESGNTSNVEKEKMENKVEKVPKAGNKVDGTVKTVPSTKTVKTVKAIRKNNSEKESVTSHKVTVKKNSTQKFVQTTLFGGNPEIPLLDCPSSEHVQDETMYKCSNSFEDLNIDPALRSYIIDKMGLTTMTEIQSQGLPVLLNKQDALIMSETGSGKTLIYALAIMQQMQAMKPPVTRKDGPLALVLVPTRELALQCYELFARLTLPVQRIVATCIAGGQKRKSEKARMRKGSNIIVTTPGRFVDHLNHTTCLSLKNIRWLVFDEADRLLDMGFQEDISHIMSTIKSASKRKRQSVLLSATLTKDVEKLAQLNLTNPVRIEVQSDHENIKSASIIDPVTGLKLEKISLPNGLTQYAVIVPSKLRLVTLLAFIYHKCTGSNQTKVLVFLSCRDSVEFHCDLINNVTIEEYNQSGEKIPTFQLHGGMTQHERVTSVQNFKRSKSAVLFCTNVASRGLDIPNIDWVVQYTSPGSPIDYIHRVGRTARAGHDGNALLFLTPGEVPYIKYLSGLDFPVKELEMDTIICDAVLSLNRHTPYNVRLQSAKETASQVHHHLEECVRNNRKMKESAVKAFGAFIKAYATYPRPLKHIFHVKMLHLGHVAKSFALQGTPSDVFNEYQRAANSFRSAKWKDTTSVPKKDLIKTNTGKAVKRHPIVNKFDLMSEFSSGVQENPKKKRKIKSDD